MKYKILRNSLMMCLGVTSLTAINAKELNKPNAKARYRQPLPSPDVVKKNRSKIDRIMNFSVSDLKKTIAKNNVIDNCLIERDNFYIAEAYQVNKDEKYAQRVILVLDELAKFYKNIENVKKYGSASLAKGNIASRAPYLAALAYDDIKSSPSWSGFSKKQGYNAKKKIYMWLQNHTLYSLKARYKSQKPNSSDYIHGSIDMKIGKMTKARWIRAAGNQNPQHFFVRVIGIGHVLNSPKIMNYIAMNIEEVYKTGHYFYADGMWNEGTWSYHNYMWGNMDTVLRMAQSYKMPAGKASKVLNFTLNGKSLSPRYKNELDLIYKYQPIMKFPNGVAIYIHDGNGGKASKNSVPQNNLEMHDFGLYTLNYGNNTNCTQLTFHNCLLSSSGFGHHHTDNLNIIYWSKNQALIDEPGHPGSNYRYYNMGPAAHNIPLVQYKGRARYNTGRWARTSLLGYDDGDSSNKIVQYVAGSSPTAKERLVRTQKRGMLLIAIDKSNSYIFDFVRLQGGQKHRLFQMSTKSEAVGQTSTVKLSANKVKEEYFPMEFKSNLSEKWLPKGSLAKAQSGDGSSDSVITWTGETTGNIFKTYVKGLKGQIIYNSFYPRIVIQRHMKKSDIDRYSGRRLDLYRSVTPNTKTLFAKIYESIAKGNKDAIKSVKWLKPMPYNDYATVAKVTLNNGRIDYIYIANDYVARKVEGLSFKARVAIISKIDGKTAFSYIFGPGNITNSSTNSTEVIGNKPIVAHIKKVYRKALDNDKFNAFDITKVLPQSAVGGELYIYNGDASGNGYRINKIENMSKGCRVYTEQTPAIDVFKGGVRRAFFPRVRIAGTPKAVYLKSKFIVKNDKIKDLMTYNNTLWNWKKTAIVSASQNQEQAQKLIKNGDGKWRSDKSPAELKITLPNALTMGSFSTKCGYWKQNYNIKVFGSNNDKNYKEIINTTLKGGSLDVIKNNNKDKYKYYKFIFNSKSWSEVYSLKLSFE